VWSVISLLSSLQSDMIKFHCTINMFMILCKICSINFFCTFFIFFLSIIFIMILCFLQSDDKLSLSHYFLIVTSSLTISAHDVILDVKCMFSYVYNCLLSSWMNVFNFCTFFVMNAFWFLLFLSSELFQRRWISFKITFSWIIFTLLFL